MQIEIHTADGFYEHETCVEELLYSKLVEVPFFPRKHDLLIIDGFNLVVEQAIMNIDKQIFEIYTEGTRSDDKLLYNKLEKEYEAAGWVEE